MGNYVTTNPQAGDYVNNPADEIGIWIPMTKPGSEACVFPGDAGQGQASFLIPNNGEYEWAGSNGSCIVCNTCPPSRVAVADGTTGINGVVPNYKRKSYNGNALNCCITGASTDGNLTCDPKYRSSNAGRVDGACAGVMDSYCDNMINYMATPYCWFNYKQMPYATKNLSWGNCSAACGGGKKTGTCSVSQNTGSNIKAVRNSLTKILSAMSDREYLDNAGNSVNNIESVPLNTIESNTTNDAKYYIFKDECKEQPLVQECNKESCDSKNNWQIPLLLFFIVVIILKFVVFKSPPKVGGYSERSPFIDYASNN